MVEESWPFMVSLHNLFNLCNRFIINQYISLLSLYFVTVLLFIVTLRNKTPQNQNLGNIGIRAQFFLWFESTQITRFIFYIIRLHTSIAASITVHTTYQKILFADTKQQKEKNQFCSPLPNTESSKFIDQRKKIQTLIVRRFSNNQKINWNSCFNQKEKEERKDSHRVGFRDKKINLWFHQRRRTKKR